MVRGTSIFALILLHGCGGGGSGGGTQPPGNTDTTPDAFSFASSNGTPLAATVVSGAATISGIDTAAVVSVVGGEYSIGCGSSFTSAAGTISDHQTICVRHVGAGTPATSTTTTLTVGGVSASFTSTTIPADTTPDAFSFTAAGNVALNTPETSNTVTIAGINAAAPISVSGGDYSIGCGANFTHAAGTISNGQAVCVRHTSAAAPATATTTTLTVGGVAAAFTSTTAAADTTPNAFSFAAVADVPFNTTQTSNAVTISGIDAATPVSVSGGQYSIGCGATFTSGSGSISNNQTVCVRHTSAKQPGVAVTTTLTVGTVQADFTSTTDNAFLLPYVNGNGQLYGYLARTQSSRLIDSGLIDANDFATYSRTLLAAKLDASNGNVTGLRLDSLVYTKGGMVYRASLAAGGSNQPVRVSSFSDVCNVSTVLRDFAAPDNSWLVLHRSGSGSGCLYQYNVPPTLVKASAGLSDTGVTIGANDGYNGSLAAMHDSMGRIVSVLVSEMTSGTQMLRRYDANMQSPKNLIPLSLDQLSVMRELWTQGMYVSTTVPGTGALQLTRYDEKSQSVTVVHTFAGNSTVQVAFDAANAYVGDGNKLLRIPHTASSASAGIVVTTLPDPQSSITITRPNISADGHAVITVFDSSSGSAGSGIWSVPAGASNGTASQLFGNGSGFSSMLGNRIFVNLTNFSTGQISSSSANADGSAVSTLADSMWGGRTQPQDFSTIPAGIGPYPFDYDLEGAQQQTFMLRVDQTGNALSVKAVDPLNPATILDLGTLAQTAPIQQVSASQDGFGTLGLVNVYFLDGTGTRQFDVYGVDLSGENSLKPLQNTSSDDLLIYPY